MKKKKRGEYLPIQPRLLQTKKFIDMAKKTKKSLTSKQSKAKKIFFIVYQLVTNINLTAMHLKGS